MTTIIEKLLEYKDCDKTAFVTYDNNFKPLKTITWKQYVEFARNFGIYLNLSNRKNVAIHSFNCPEWFISAMGSIFSGRYFCGIYNTNRDDQCIHVIEKGDCNVINREKVEFTEQQLEKVEKLKITYWENLNLDKPEYYKSLDLSMNDDPDKVCTLIFTSGTTGNPKAVELTHKNVLSAVKGVLKKLEFKMFEERYVSYLPLSHIAGQAVDMYCPLFNGGEVHFARADALKGSLKDTLLAVRPTVFLGVPRVWEKFREGLNKVAEKRYNQGLTGRVLGKVMNIVKCIEKEYNTSENYYYQSALYPLTFLTSRFVNKIKEALGLDQCRYFASGAAPISKEVLEYFSSIGINIMEIYGMSETSGLITIADPIDSIHGSCGKITNEYGKPAENIEVKIGDNDEILVKGDNVFKRYTGDCGRIDEKGLLYITGRIKELIITAGGENVPTPLIESKIKSLINTESHCVLIGDKRKFLTMLIFNPANEKQLDDKAVESSIKKYNNEFAISNSQKVQKFKIIHDELSIDNGLMTPTMKLKRSKILEKYANEIDSMYPNDE
jgi:long-chain-fatty-acid--CoA ligase ACSBG